MKTANIFFLTVFALSLSLVAGRCYAFGPFTARNRTAAPPIPPHVTHPLDDTKKIKLADRSRKHRKQPASVFSNLYLSAPHGQGQYVQNGDVLIFKGTTIPHASILSAYIEDERGFLVRDVSKGITIQPETGDLGGSFFVGSFRHALFVRLSITIYNPSTKKKIKGTTNTLSVDNSYPQVTVIEPINYSYFKAAPIKITGTAADTVSGVADIEISFDGGASYVRVDSFSNGRWQYLFTPKNTQTLYSIKARTTDRVGHCSVSDNLVIHCKLPHRTAEKITQKQKMPTARYHEENADKSPDEDGICTYRIINLNNNRFQPSDLFTLKEEMAIIVKGYGGKMVTIKIIDPTGEKVVFELSDYIPANKNKMWKWKLSKTGIFQAGLFVDGSQKDDVFFKIIQ